MLFRSYNFFFGRITVITLLRNIFYTVLTYNTPVFPGFLIMNVLFLNDKMNIFSNRQSGKFQVEEEEETLSLIMISH